MITRCPACDTAYRVRAEQLALREGHVRCGHCSTIFDARTSLVAEPEAEPPELNGPASVAEVGPAAEAEAGAEAHVPAQAAAGAVEPPEASLAPAREPSPEEEDADFDFGPQPRQQAQLRTAAWAGACVAALAVLAAQAAYAYRTELATALPSSRASLEAACQAFGCTIPLPKRADLISIESSELYPERGIAGVLTLAAVLRNRANFAQALPALELTLTDTRDQPVARRVLKPGDYAADRAGGEPAFGPNSERSIKLHIEAAGLEPGGYRLYAFYL